MDYNKRNKFYDFLLVLCVIALFAIILIKTGNINMPDLSGYNENVNTGNILNKIEYNQKTAEIADEVKDRAKRFKTELPENTENTKNAIEIKVNRPEPFSYLSKYAVYKKRIEAVNNSVFADYNYEPSEEVFGQIIDKKPWISVNRCTENNTANIDGPSEETRDVLNPSILVSIDWPVMGNFAYAYPQLCYDELLPEKVLYYPEMKQTDVIYSSVFSIPEHSYFMLKGLNANDLGYKYGYIDFKKSKNLLTFSKGDNITKRVVQFRDYIHLGGSCNVEGGCNNGSPYQPYLEFYYNPRDKATSHILYIKLWKNEPYSPDAPADFIERIIIK